MLAFQDATEQVNGPKSARLESRTQPSVKADILTAAALNGVDASSFIISAAYSEARATIEAHKTTVIESDADRAAFFDALENPAKPTKRLADASALHKKLIANAD